MKFFLLILYLALSAGAISLDTIVRVNSNTTIGYSNSNLTIDNDSNEIASITIDSGKVWLNSRNNKILVFTTIGKFSVDGVSYLTLFNDTATIKVFKGSVIFTSVGNNKGEIIQAGYERIIDIEGQVRPRKLINNDEYNQLCLDSSIGIYFDCVYKSKEDSIELADNFNCLDSSITLIFHPTTYHINSDIDTLQWKDSLQNEVETNLDCFTIEFDTTQSFVKSSELSKSGIRYWIIDIKISEQEDNLVNLDLTIFNGKKQESYRFSQSGIIFQTFSVDNNHSYIISPKLQNFIIEKIDSLVNIP